MINLTRKEAQQVLDALQCATPPTFSTKLVEDWQSAVEFLRTRLAQPEPEPDGVTPSEQYAFERGYQRALEVVRETHKWQSLTTAEIKTLWNLTKKPSEFAEMLLAKVKEKNVP